jgi:lipopolysaccharide transport protein LptA
MKKTILYCLLMLICCPGGASPLGEGAFEMISIAADEAREDEEPGILHFNGNFVMRSGDWHLTSEQATVYGSPDQPDRILLEGAPARFLVNRTELTDQGPVEGTAPVVEYLREVNLLLLSGGATLVLGGEVIHSAQIAYNIDTRRYQAGGADGVQIEVPPDY